MTAIKHLGRIKNTGKRCIVVFREIYNDQGHVIDENSCLVVETDSLPDAESQEIMKIVESEPAQSTGDIYNVLARERLSSGYTTLSWLTRSGRLRKYPTGNIELIPNSETTIALDQLNKIVKMQKSGASQVDIENVLQDDTDLQPRQAKEVNQMLHEDNFDAYDAPEVVETQSGQGNILSDSDIAKRRLEQARQFEAQAKEMRQSAYTLDPSLKPKRRTTKKKVESAEQ